MPKKKIKLVVVVGELFFDGKSRKRGETIEADPDFAEKHLLKHKLCELPPQGVADVPSD